MKSSESQLNRRGFIPAGVEETYPDMPFKQCVELVKSNLPKERTLGARLLTKSGQPQAIGTLLDALKVEQQLYSKLAMCDALVSFGKEGVIPLVALLGKIGNNQHRIVSEIDYKKKSYPLPRDIAGRTLIRIGVDALPELLEVLQTDSVSSLSEAIDAIGFICFYSQHQPNVYRLLEKCFQHNSNDLVRWKIIRAMSAFPESKPFLKEQQQTVGPDSILRPEIERSLALLART